MMDLLNVETCSCFQASRAKYMFRVMTNFLFFNF